MKEYQSVILAGLLHDIGKFTNRMRLERGRHPKHSEIFVRSNEFKSLLEEDWVDIELTANLVKCHHEDPRIGSDLLVDAIQDERTRALAYMVSRADNYSSSERISSESDIRRFYKTVPLDSLFPTIVIDERKEIRKAKLRYQAKPLSVDSIFPREFETLPENEIDALVNGFGKEVSQLKTADFNHFYQGLMSLLEKYTWCIPSDTTSEMSDISLYDHLRTTSAIAACLYQYYKDQLNEAEIKDDRKEKFLLVGGDLSGIQNYIYTITGSDSTGKGISKRLRARSFYLNVLTEVCIHRILHCLNLPLSCILMASGGRFILLAPNTAQVKNMMSVLSQKISQWFIKEFRGELSLILTWDCEMSGKGFQDLSNILNQLDDSIQNKKKHKYYEVIFSDAEKVWLGKNFVFSADYEKYHQYGECNSCHMFPALDKNGGLCRHCQKDLTIGSGLPGSRYLLFRKGNCRNQVLSFFEDQKYCVELIKNDTDIRNLSKNKDVYLIKRMIPLSGKEKGTLDNPGYMDDYLLNTVPYFADNQEKQSLCQVCNQRNHCEEHDELVSESNNPYTFSCLAATSSWFDEQGKIRGEQLLGVLKADVDWLGLIFSSGLKKRTGKLTVSRYATLSRMMNYFFLGWIKNELIPSINKTSPGKAQKERDFSKIYGVYSGGDDLLLIGPWETIILFAQHLYQSFREYTGHNDNITLSAGIAVTKPRFPMYRAVAIAEKYLTKSKESGKDRITLFNTTIPWQEFKQLESFKNLLCQELSIEHSRLNLSFLYRLFNHHQIYLSYRDENKVEGLRFHSHLAYDVARNIMEKGRPSKTNDSQESSQMFLQELKKLYSIMDFDQKLMNNLKIPLFWTIYKFRK